MQVVRLVDVEVPPLTRPGDLVWLEGGAYYTSDLELVWCEAGVVEVAAVVGARHVSTYRLAVVVVGPSMVSPWVTPGGNGR